jgi:hypothetical protein
MSIFKISNNISYNPVRAGIIGVQNNSFVGRPLQTQPPSNNWDLGSNLPTGGGWTLRTDNQWTTQWGSGWDIATNRAPNPAPEIITDPTGTQPATTVNGVTKSSSLILNQIYTGTPDGYEPQFPFFYWPTTQELFFSTVCYIPATWQQPTTSGVKWLLVEGSSGAGLVGWAGLGGSTNPARVGLPGSLVAGEPYWDWVFDASANSPYTGVANLPPIRNEPLTRGQWHKLQCYIRSGDPDVVYQWVDDVLVTDSTQTPFTFTSSTQRFDGIQFGATWGGGIGYPAPEGNVIYHARTAIWTR